MGKLKKYLQFIIWGVVTVILVATIIVANVITSIYSPIITTFLGQTETELINDGDEGEDTEHYKSSYSRVDRLRRNGEELCEDIVQEGTILLENNEVSGAPALPLTSTERNIHFFSLSSYDFVTGGVGSGSINDDTSLRLNDIFGNAGYNVNNTLWQHYYSNYRYGQRSYAQERQGINSGHWLIGDLDASQFPDNIKSTYTGRGENNVAVTVIARMGGEGSDLPHYVYYDSNDAARNEGTEHFLQLTTKEKNTLAEVGQAGFGKHIVIVNTSNAMELDWINDPAYKIDAVLLVSTVGQVGLAALPKIFSGEVNPSGRLIDTWAYDALSAPATRNMGSNQFSNAGDYNLGTQFDDYLVYQEGIYVGYKYYETRYYDKMTEADGVGDYDYETTVQYPFGYGNSYTTFGLSDFTVSEPDSNDNINLSVTVTNTGNTAGKSSVQFYMSAPYDPESGIERAAIELVEFEKTTNLDPAGDNVDVDDSSDTLTVSVPKEYLKAYDYKTGDGGYVIQGGDYYFTAAFNAHDAVNNILAAKEDVDGVGNAALADSITLAADTTTYKTSDKSGKTVEVNNKFQNAELNALDHSITYLSRSNWTGTFPTGTYRVLANDKIVEQQRKLTLDDVPTDSAAKTPVTNGNTDATAFRLMGKSFDDPLWEDLLDRMSFNEMQELIRIGGYKTSAVPSIAFNAVGDQDGPAGISGTLIGAGSGCMAYPSQATVAATFNKRFLDEFGELVAEDALHSQDAGRRLAGWYAPAVNIHRTPFSGRNYEYYSEDPVLSGLMGARVINAAHEKGVVTFLKHFAFNDQETNRNGLNVFANEQTLRELYLKPFEICLQNSNEGACSAIMSSYNRIGGTWTGGYKPLITGVLREEWGFVGRVLSDYIGSDVCESYISIYNGLLAGNDQMLNTNTLFYRLDGADKNPTVMKLMRESCHRILYSAINSAGMNGIGANTRVIRVIPLWKALLITGTVVISVGLAVWGGLITFFFIRKKKKSAA